ncbi:response regulator [Spirosoma sp.]|uniref:response regulator n=1 Tax=Spirosoma sp. TaxID=1899569 RepID=UPI0026079AD9|nr:response regulator [Spirosoma sp.]MCX6212905.1 response regulator [Spirosoma sp.]
MTNPKEVYLVDDAYDYRYLVQGIFARHLPTYQLRLFDGGNALAQHVLRTMERPALIMLDRHMPHRDGYQTLQIIKQHPYWNIVPVVMLSADASPEDIQKGYRLGVNSFLQKPMDFNSLRSLIESTCHYWLTMNQPFDSNLSA